MSGREDAPEALDLRGLKCPLPALLARRALLAMPAGQIVEVLCDDPLCGIDLPHMCHQENIAVLHQTREGKLLRLWLRRGCEMGQDIASP
jgi:tRNA 2-thiouridine synthesizing protein A